jgi:D-cysteine desulfhydrase
VVTFGGVGSNHALCTAVFAQKLGLTATLLLLPEPNTAHVREHLLANLRFGAHMRLGSNGEIARLTLRASRDELAPDEPYVIAAGGTSPLGNVGFVNAAFELQQQVRSGELPEPDDLFIPAGTGGSAVGLAVGLSAAGMHTRVRAVRTSSTRYVSRAGFARQFAQTVALLRRADDTFPAVELDPSRLLMVDGYVGRGYALETSAADRAASLAASEAGLVLDPTYTAKTMAALVGTATEIADGVVLYWYTFDPRRMDVSMVRIEDVPQAFRGYFVER